MRDMGPILEEIQQLKAERDKYRQEAMNERELTQAIVAEREELILQNEKLSQENKKLLEELETLSGY